MAQPPTASDQADAAAKAASSRSNDLMPFLTFVEHHPVGTEVDAVVDHYSSHGAYVFCGPVLAYVPLRLMSDPPPRSAREMWAIGDVVKLFVHGFTPARRSIDLATAAMAAPLLAKLEQDRATAAAKPAKPARASAKRTKTAAPAHAAPVADVVPVAEAMPTAAPKRGQRRGKAQATTATGPEIAPATAVQPDSEAAEVAAVAVKAARTPRTKPSRGRPPASTKATTLVEPAAAEVPLPALPPAAAARTAAPERAKGPDDTQALDTQALDRRIGGR